MQASLIAVLAGFASLGVLAAGAFGVITAALQGANGAILASAESVREAEEAAIDLLVHARSRDALVRMDHERRLASHLVDADRLLATQEEHAAAHEAVDAVGEYLLASRMGAPGIEERLERAYAAVGALVDVNIAHARAARASAARWQRIANVAGISLALTLVLASGVLGWWLKTRALRPVLELSDALARFGGGDPLVRAREVGPEEVARMARDFNRMADALARQRQGQAAFLASVAHDLRNPISALKLTAAAVPPGGPLPPEVRMRRAFEVVRRQATKLERMLNDLLDTARIEAGEVEMRVERVDLRELVRAALELFEGTSPGHRLVSEVPDHPVPVYCDPLRIEQVLANLLSNAIKYSPAGGEVRATLRVASGEAVIQVADQGIGISERDRATIFEPFRRTGSLRSAVAGTGLGLYVVRRLVEAHAGSVAVASLEGTGTIFTVRLPLAHDAPRLASENESAAPAAP
ncbi:MULTISPECIES: HAMP domain-containing sensor histidine kinase [Anaeromyxobacter]|uniref:HAMP domain-containing sensor histidine kinase n=1 Tax=Anaeromyxobacter TaxID=161492 RepID=UPI001F5A5D17|nr:MULTISPECIES: HAMP domain-containing sensor histidine kinase [unclassified Anaeromyxobacter]